MLMDTHCHLDASEFDTDRRAVIDRARSQGVRAIVIPAVRRGNFAAVRELARSFDGGCYALGIHPLYVPQAQWSDLDALRAAVRDSMDDARFVAIGEIGLDFFVPELTGPAMREKQEAFYQAQLDVAREFELPVLLHVRRSQDRLLKYLRQRPVQGGIAHAFNGSFQQAGQFIDHGFALGLGGAMTFERALRIRRLATRLALENLVLETDAPDISPEWLCSPGRVAERNEPCQVGRIASVLAQLRGETVREIARATADAACRVLPRLAGNL
ncbi:MAG: TatD family hydrolase [Candidimonas sp.]